MWILLLLLLCLPVAAQEPPMLDSPLTTALCNDFFQHFHFKPAGNGVYRPQAPEAASLVTLRVQVDGQQVVRGLELEVKHSFIADPKIGRMARDLVKSFLECGPLQPDPQLVADVWNAPAQNPSPGFAVYLGKSPRWSSGPVTLENGEGVLRVRLGAPAK